MMNRHVDRRWLATAVGVVAVVFGVGVLPSSPVAAGAILSVGPTFPTSVTVGQTNIPASITITNNNTPPEVASTVCRHDDVDPGPLSECVDNDGIVLTPSCGAQSVQFVICTVPGADPNVLRINPSATGSGACLGVSFTAVPLNDQFGRYRFDPPLGVHVVLPTPGSPLINSRRPWPLVALPNTSAP